MATETFSWTLTAYEQDGRLFLQWNTTAPFMLTGGQISVYSGEVFPTDPEEDRVFWEWDDASFSPLDTKLPWKSSGWYCAHIAKASDEGAYVYVMQLIATNGANPESAGSE